MVGTMLITFRVALDQHFMKFSEDKLFYYEVQREKMGSKTK